MVKRNAVLLSILICLVVFALISCGNKNNNSDSKLGSQGKGEIILATTTSTQDTGLLDVLIPLFEQKTGYKVKTIAVGTGQALAMGERGDADVMLVHAPEAEMELVKKGAAINRKLVMHNDFVVVGPPEDPAGIGKAKSAAEAFKLIAQKQVLFISRGDDSGTHRKELQIWELAGIENPEDRWYQSTGQGMGTTLDIASEKVGYTLTDRGTYLVKRDNIRLEILVEGAKELLNIYHVMQTNPEYVKKTNPNAARMINYEGAKAFVDFMVSEEVQKIIGEFGKDKFGQPLFFPDAGKDEGELLK
ncbi:tungstate transport system substrate-binding protein [Caldanaerovirga acetigignens]|uniref:Tungstate transport system substrate-binding protein n=1 Tax=Caldanaerovirga acetigignens TaxID=447595 RepID=A0A1M7I7I8_9FIRM|nr:tungstate transport system substrate-binding protein [Caldanaerovirga acetigignens]